MWTSIKRLLDDTYLHPRHISRREIASFVRTEGPRLTGRLLDVGCGKKPYGRLLPNVDQHWGSDMPSTMHGLEHANVFASALALPFPDHTFDSVMCTEVLEHTPDPATGLREMARVAKPDALLLLTVPASEQLHEKPYDYCRFTCYWLEYLMSETGWEIMRLQPRGGAWLEMGYRFSSFLYTTLGATSDSHGKLTPRAFASWFVVPVCACVQLLAVLLDKVWPSNISTMGYGAIARRRLDEVSESDSLPGIASSASSFELEPCEQRAGDD
jgi:SAM-dependent methyltransferase